MQQTPFQTLHQHNKKTEASAIYEENLFIIQLASNNLPILSVLWTLHNLIMLANSKLPELWVSSSEIPLQNKSASFHSAPCAKENERISGTGKSKSCGILRMGTIFWPWADIHLWEEELNN